MNRWHVVTNDSSICFYVFVERQQTDFRMTTALLNITEWVFFPPLGHESLMGYCRQPAGWVGGRAGGVDTQICECNNLRTTQHSSIKLAPLVHLLKSHTSLNLTDLSLKVKVRGQALT